MNDGGGDDTKDTVLPNFIDFCVKISKNFKGLFDFDPEMQPKIPYLEFIDAINEIDYKTDFQSDLIKKLDTKNTGVTIDAKNLEALLNKAFSKKKLTQGTANKRLASFDDLTKNIMGIIMNKLD